jgi:hypothetical protein
MRQRVLFTQEETDIIIEMYPDHYTSAVAEKLGRDICAVYRKAAKLGVKKSAAFIQKELKERQAEKLRIVGEHARFQKGQTPHNKSKKMAPDVYEKCSKTMFKKGQIPVNLKPEGSERKDKDGHILIKVGNTYVHKQRYIYEQTHGIEVPKDHVVAFADGNKENFDISNLVLMTMAENMLRNTIHRYPADLKQVIKLTSKLKRIIHEKQNRRSQESSFCDAGSASG